MARAHHRARAPRRRGASASAIPRSPTSRATRARSRSPDGAFDVVYSNAVIEHVGGRERQRRFVREALRVGRRVFLTTPNRWFPVEVHTRLPLVHWLPDDLADRAYDLAGKPWAKENHLLGPAELRGALPRAGADRQPRADARRDRT